MTLRNQNFLAGVIVLSFAILVAATFLTTDKGLALQTYQGPLDFWTQIPLLYVVLGVAALLVFLITPNVKNNSSFYFAMIFVVFGAYLVKLLLPYYIFDGLVHFDIFCHYPSVQMLVSGGIQLQGYLYWPNTFLLTDMFEKVTETIFPLSTSLTVVLAEITLALLLFGFVKRLFGHREAILSLLLLTIVEPVSLHWCPFTFSLTVIFVSFVALFYGILRSDKRFTIIGIIAALSSILYHAFNPIILALMCVVGVSCFTLLSKFSLIKVKVSFSNVYFILALIIGTISWWLYVSFTVFWNFTTILSSLLMNEMRPYSYMSVVSSQPELVNQLKFMNILSYCTLFILILPVIPVLLWALHLMLQKKLDVKHIKILFLASVTITMELIFFFLKLIEQNGFSQRFFFIGNMLLVLLSAVCIFELTRKRKLKKMIYILFAVLFITVVVISPITNLSDYGAVNLISVTRTDEKTAAFAATYSIEGQSIEGDLRLLEIVEFFRWPDLLPFSFQFESNIESGSFTYSSPETEIVVSHTTSAFVTVQGINDLEAANYIDGLYNNSNLVYSNSYNTVFVSR